VPAREDGGVANTLPRSPAPRIVLLSVPPLGAGLVALATLSDGLYRFLVREDALLEWIQVVAYLTVVAIAVKSAPRLWRRGDRLASLVVIGLGVISLLSIGEELSWGQRLIGFGTPEIASQNRQGELTFHNDSRVEASTHRVLLVVGFYGVLAPLLIRSRTPVVPPWTLSCCFAVIAVYYSVRLGFLDSPSYVEAKYSEWPETCLAAALVFWAWHVGSTFWTGGLATHTPTRHPTGRSVLPCDESGSADS
jgi:hypothetical protein